MATTLCGIALVIAMLNQATFAASVYENFDYGFMVEAPKDLSIGADPNSATNHGFAVNLPSSAHLTVTAAYDALFMRSAIADIRQIIEWEHWGKSVRIQRFKVAGLESALAMRDTPTSHAVRISAYRGGILYSFTLDGKSMNKSRDDAVFWALVRGFSLRPLP